MPRQIRLNAFDMNCVGHQSPGLWTHPRTAPAFTTRSTTGLSWHSSSSAANSTHSSWPMCSASTTSTAGSPDAAIAQAVQMPVNDPLLLIPAMAYVTRNLGFGVTCAVSYEHPCTLGARRRLGVESRSRRLFRSRGIKQRRHEPTRTFDGDHAVPMVRILFPPAGSLQTLGPSPLFCPGRIHEEPNLSVPPAGDRSPRGIKGAGCRLDVSE